MTTDETCIVGIRTPKGNTVQGFNVCIRGEEVYTNYCDRSTPEAHASYHRSGQYHMKREKQYIEWTGGMRGCMEPMKLFRTPPGLVRDRVHFWTIGWDIANVHAILPPLSDNADMIVDASHIEPPAILGFEASVVGQYARERKNVVGFPIIASQTFGRNLKVEICCFVVRENQVDEANPSW